MTKRTPSYAAETLCASVSDETTPANMLLLRDKWLLKYHIARQIWLNGLYKLKMTKKLHQKVIGFKTVIQSLCRPANESVCNDDIPTAISRYTFSWSWLATFK